MIRPSSRSLTASQDFVISSHSGPPNVCALATYIHNMPYIIVTPDDSFLVASLSPQVKILLLTFHHGRWPPIYIICRIS